MCKTTEIVMLNRENAKRSLPDDLPASDKVNFTVTKVTNKLMTDNYLPFPHTFSVYVCL